MSPEIDIAFLAESKYKDRSSIELILSMDLSASGSRGMELRIPDLISAAYAACRIIDFCDLNKEERTFFFRRRRTTSPWSPPKFQAPSKNCVQTKFCAKVVYNQKSEMNFFGFGRKFVTKIGQEWALAKFVLVG